MSLIEPDVVSEGERLLGAAKAGGIPLRLLGGVAIRLRALREPLPAFERPYEDLDFATTKRGRREAPAFFREQGYEPHTSFNALHGQERLLFFDTENDRQVDVFVGGFSMCHRIPLDDRLELDPISIPLAELLLTKLQVIELNEKDVRDTLWLLLDHPVGEGDGDMLNAGQVARLCADDWGLWRTITQNLTVCCGYAGTFELPQEARSLAEKRLDALLERIEAEPKSRAWRLRARIGDRKRWYDLPEEVRR
jgi:hypothetical protein